MVDKKLTAKDLSRDQREVYETMNAWAEGDYFPDSGDGDLLTVGGYAGTGKSTLVGVFAASTKATIAYVSFTGRASSILGRKLKAAGVVTTGRYRQTRTEADRAGDENDWSYPPGHPEEKLPFCGTIHRLLYKPMINEKMELIGWRKRDQLDRKYDLIVVDEASMVGKAVLEDLRAHNVPILAVGDHGQLPPVADSSDLMREPDLRLEKIHRQADGNPVIHLAHMVREGEWLPMVGTSKGKATWRDARVAIERKDAFEKVFLDAANRVKSPLDVGVLCWTNKTRVRLNATCRAAFGHKGLPFKGEPLICLYNRPPVFNGMRGVLTTDCERSQKVAWWLVGDLEFPDEELPPSEYTFCSAQFLRDRTFETIDELRTEARINVESMPMAGDLYDFGYCLTVHKCVAPDTLVETPEGLVRARLLDAVESKIVATPNGEARYQGFVRNGVGPMLEIMTEDGYSLRVTPNHGVDVWSPDDGYVRREAHEIRRGDFVRLRLGAQFKTGRRFLLPGARPQDVRARKYALPQTCDGDLAEFLGLMVADGTVYAKGFRLAKRHEDVADRFDALCRKLFCAVPSRFFKLNAHHVEVSSALIADWLRDVGGMAPNEKAVPECIFAASLATQARFLRGLFEDGTVNLKGDTLDHIEFTSTRPEVRRAVRTMLLRFGIVAGTTSSRPESLYLYGQYAKRFGDAVGFVSKFKQSRLKTARAPEGTRYVFPLLRDEAHLSEAGKATIQRHRAPRKQFADRAPYHHALVQSVTRYRGESVCVEVPDGHRFIQDGFCGWNSQGSQFEHAIVYLDRREDPSNEEYRRWIYTAVTRAAERLTVLR